MSVVELPVGRSKWVVTVREADLMTLDRPAPTPIANVRAAVQEALEHPLRFEAFRRALTPDDRISLIVDESLPQLPELIAGVLEYLATAGINPPSVTALSPPGASQIWINDLPDAFAELQTEIHQPTDRQKLSYLGATSDARPIYLNRTLVDADQIIVLSGRGYDALSGYSGGAASIYPSMADADALRGVIAKMAPQHTTVDEWPLAKEASDTCWLLGAPFFIQVLEGPGDSVQQIIAGFLDTTADGVTALNKQWQSSVGTRPDTVIATLSGDPHQHDFAALARAAACAAHIVKPQGTIIILSEAEPELGEAVNVLRRCDDSIDAMRAIFQQKPPDAVAAGQWAWAAGQASIYLVSEIRPDVVEEIFATPLSSPRDVQKLLEAPGTCLVITDAHKSDVMLKK